MDTTETELQELRRHTTSYITHDDGGKVAEPVSQSKNPPIYTHTDDLKMWAIHGHNYFPCESTIPSLPPGQYTIGQSENRGIFFSKKNICLDELLILPDSTSEEILNGITHFWTQEKKFREFSFLWKRGVLLWGPTGSGKTSLVQLLSKKIVELGGFSVYVDCPDVDARGLEILRRIEPTRPIVVMLEDIDAIIKRYNEATVLALFDGELQIDNVVYIATTNYPGRLDPRIINRPSRFDVVKKIGMPSSASREVYLRHKHPALSESTLKSWIDATEDFSFAHLKELIIAVECLGQKFEDVIYRLREMMKLNQLPEFGEDYKKKHGMGFEGSHVE